MWSFPSAWNVFVQFFYDQARWDAADQAFVYPFPDQACLEALPFVGALTMALIYIESVAIAKLCVRWPGLKSHIMGAGLLVTIAALIGSAFSRRAIDVIMLQGILYGIGGGTSLLLVAVVHLQVCQVHCIFQRHHSCQRSGLSRKVLLKRRSFDWFVEKRGLVSLPEHCVQPD